MVALCFYENGYSGARNSHGVKYYTHFVLTGEAVENDDQEFSGVVEVNKPIDPTFDGSDIEELLARKFDIRACDVKLINWSRLQ